VSKRVTKSNQCPALYKFTGVSVVLREHLSGFPSQTSQIPSQISAAMVLSGESDIYFGGEGKGKGGGGKGRGGEGRGDEGR